MSQPTATDLDPLKPAVEKLETCLVTPLLPGELATWSANLRAAFDDVVRHLQLRRASQDQSLAEIGQQDADLLPRVEQLKSQREELWRHAQEASETIARVVHRAPGAEPDEQQAAKLVSDAVSRGLDFVIRLRAFEAALATWLVEAFQRDGGVGD